MKLLLISVLLGLTASSNAIFGGPFLFWGEEKVSGGQNSYQNCKDKLRSLYKDAQKVLIFIRNETGPLEAERYPLVQNLMKQETWAYMPQLVLPLDPFQSHNNHEVITLKSWKADETIVNSYKRAVNTYGVGKVLAILAAPERISQSLISRQQAYSADDYEEPGNSTSDESDGMHSLSKREAKDGENEGPSTTAAPGSDETDESFIYLADGKKAILFVNAAPVLNISNSKESIKLLEHRKAITFDDQKAKGYGRLNIIFTVDGEKVFLRFNFTLSRGTWAMKGVEVEYKEYKNVLPIVGNVYNVPSAPVGFSYRCSARPILFVNGKDSLVVTDYQVQPWLNGKSKFGDVYDCIGFTTAPIWAGVLVTLFLSGILAIGLIALMDIKTPNRFESSRSKQLTFTVQE